MDVKIKKLSENAVIPSYQVDGDAGMDLVAISKNYDAEKDVFKYGFGLALEIPKGFVGYVFPRSSCYKSGMTLANCVGVIDSGYRGEISAVFDYVDDLDEYNVGDRVAQLIIMPVPKINFIPVTNLQKSDRGSGSFGSTGA